MFQHLSEDATEMNFKKDIDDLLLQTSVLELKKVAVIMKINLDEEEDLQLCQFLRIPQTHVDKVEDLLVVSGIKQILFDMMQANEAVQKAQDDQSGTLAIGKDTAVTDILWTEGFDSKVSASHQNFKIRGAIGETHQKDKLSYLSLLKQIKKGKDKGYSDKQIANAVIKVIITPGLYPQSFFETNDNFTLDGLIKFL